MYLFVTYDSPASGSWNMAVDDYLLDWCCQLQQPRLRFYRWDAATLSLGYFQRADERQTHVASDACPVVRRSTGGGAIVHDQELTYSLVLPAQQADLGQAQQLYDVVHRALLKVMQEWNVVLDIHAGQPQTPEPFLCFQRRSRGDVMLGNHKVMGSAQRRRRSALLQHGSLLWQCSNRAPELPGIADLAEKAVPDFAQIHTPLAERWAAEIAEKMGWQLQHQPGEWPGEVESIEQAKYAAQGWTLKR